MNTKASTTADDELREQLKALRSDLDKLSKLVVRSSSEHGPRLVDDARATGESVLDEAMKSVDAGRELGEQQIESAERWIRKNPFVAILCAIGAGFVLAQFRSRN